MRDEICMMLNELTTENLIKVKIIVSLLSAGWSEEQIVSLILTDH